MADLLTITVSSQEHLTVSLFRDRNRVDTMMISVGRDLDTVLIATLDSFLKRNRIEPLSLRAVKVSGAIDKFSSVYRIVKAWQQAVQCVSSQERPQ